MFVKDVGATDIPCLISLLDNSVSPQRALRWQLCQERQNPGGFRRWWNRSSTRSLAVSRSFIITGVITFYPLFYQVCRSMTDWHQPTL
jgi:hypothetical protein